MCACNIDLFNKALNLSLQRDVDRDQNNHVDSMHDDKMDHKIGRDFRNLGHHPGMVHLHSGMEHLTNVDVEVNIY